MAFELVGRAVKKLRLPTVNYDNAPIKVIPAQKGDVNSRYFFVELYDDRGTIDLSIYTSANLGVTMPSEEAVIYSSEIDKENNRIIVKVIDIRIDPAFLRSQGKSDAKFLSSDKKEIIPSILLRRHFTCLLLNLKSQMNLLKPATIITSSFNSSTKYLH